MQKDMLPLPPTPTVTKNGTIRTVPISLSKDEFDWKALRWNGDEHHGWMYGRFFQSVPMFFTAEGHNLWLGDMFRGLSVFLIASGPSLKRYDLTKLQQPGVMTLGLNNSPRVVRPRLWTCVDSPHNFMRSIWLDPTIMKFVPICSTDKFIFDNDSIVVRDQNGNVVFDDQGNPKINDDKGAFLKNSNGSNLRVRDCPNVVYFRRNEFFQASQFLWEDTFNWGNHGDFGGARSVLLVAIRLAYVLGFRRVFLLGVDFQMSETQKYSFPQDRSISSIKGNNQTYEKLIERFTQLKPIFDREGFEVYQCNHESRLKVFPHIPFDDAVQLCLEEFWHGGTPIDIQKENTFGLYDREDRMKKAAEEKTKQHIEQVKHVLNIDKSKLKKRSSVTSFPSKPKRRKGEYTEEEKQEVKRRLDIARNMLNQAKDDLDRLIKNEPQNPNEEQLQDWMARVQAAQDNVAQLRMVFRTIEDEKRWKHGEDIRWGLWNPDLNDE